MVNFNLFEHKCLENKTVPYQTKKAKHNKEIKNTSKAISSEARSEIGEALWTSSAHTAIRLRRGNAELWMSKTSR